MNWPVIVLGLVTSVLTVVRWRRVRGSRRPMWDANLLAVLILLSTASMAFGVYRAVADWGPWKNAGLALFHVGISLLAGCSEMVVYQLRHERPQRQQEKAIIARAVAIATLVFLTWPIGFADVPVDDLIQLRDRPAVALHSVVFHAYGSWALSSVTGLCLQRAWRDKQRRLLKAISYLMVALGCGGFAIVNVIFLTCWLTGADAPVERLYSFGPLEFLFIAVGMTIINSGETFADEVEALRELRVVGPLWKKVGQLADVRLPLPRLCSARVRLQRAYAEIADALALLGPTRDIDGTPAAVADAIANGDVEMVRTCSLSQVLPPRRDRHEDLQIMRQIAESFIALPDHPRTSRGLTVWRAYLGQ